VSPVSSAVDKRRRRRLSLSRLVYNHSDIVSRIFLGAGVSHG